LGSSATTLQLRQSNALLRFTGAGSIGGSGTVYLSDTDTSAGKLVPISGGSLTIGAGIHVDSGPASGGTLGDPAHFLLNHGVISSTNRTITITGSDWINDGTISVGPFAAIYLSGTFRTSSLGTIVNQNRIEVRGTLDNTGANLDFANLGMVDFAQGGQLVGGTVTNSASGIARLSGGLGTFSGITLGCNAELESSMYFKNGLNFNGHDIRMRVAQNGVNFVTPQVIPSGSTVYFDTVQGLPDSVGSFGGPGMIVAAGATLRTGNVFENSNRIDVAVDQNHGTIEALSPAMFVRLNAPSWSNIGTISMSAGGIILHNSWVNSGSILGSGGTLYVTGFGSWNNSGTITIGEPAAGVFRGTFNNIGTIDLNGAMVVDYDSASPVTLIANQIIAGRAGGTWNGLGIKSSACAASPLAVALGFAESAALFHEFPATFIGQTVDATSVLARRTRLGDANLDGLVNLADFNRIASNFGQTSKIWYDGDFNYDGLVNLADFNLLASNFGLSAGPDGVVDPGDWSALATAVPEPMVGLWFGVGLMLVCTWRPSRLLRVEGIYG
jgi:hypothetical protein